MGTMGCLLILAAIAAHAAAYGKMKEEVVVELPSSTAGICVRLLNGTHEVGCGSSSAGDEGVIVVARTKADVEGALNGWTDRFPHYSGGFMLLMDELLLDGDTAPLLISATRVAGVLLMPTKDDSTVPKNARLSAEPACPNQRASLYSDWRACGSSAAKMWNGKGAMLEQGMRFTEWPKPLVRITNETVLETMIKCHDAYNLPGEEQRTGRVEGRLCAVGTVKTFMLASGSSTECMRRQETIISPSDLFTPKRTLCDPLGDYNLFGIIPPGAQSKTGEGAYLAVITRMDGVATISDASPSTYGTMTSLVAALTAAKVIGDNVEKFESASKISNKRILFAFLHGESFDYVGSSRWVYDMEHGKFPARRADTNEDVPELISMEKISLAVELQQIDGSEVLHAHVDGKNYETDKKGKVKKALEKMKDAMKGDGVNLRMERVATNGVLPPSSLHSILKRRRQTPSVLITSFDDQYSNRRYHSVYDRVVGGKAEVDKVRKTIAAVSKGVVALLADHVGIDQETQKKLKIDEEWLDMLSSCFIATSKIPDCPYINDLFGNIGTQWDRSTFISAGRVSVLRKAILALLVISTGEHKSTSNVRDKESCKHLNEKQALYEYVWMKDPTADNSTSPSGFFCYRTSIRDANADSPAFIPDANGATDLTNSNYSSWVESIMSMPGPYSLFLVDSRPADFTVMIVGLLVALLSILIIGRCDDSSFIVDEGERAAEEGEPL